MTQTLPDANATTHTHRRYPAYRDSGIAWLGEVPAHWTHMTIRAITRDVRERNRPDLPLLSVYRDYGVIEKESRDDNHNRAGDDLANYKVVQPGRLVLNKMKTWQGSLGVSNYHGIVSPAYITCNLIGNIIPRYIHHLLRSASYIAAYNQLSYGVRVDQWDMRYEDFKELSIYLPPVAEQRAIAAYLDRETTRIDALVAKKQRLIELLREKRAALISHAVTRGLDPNAPLKDSGVPWLGQIPAGWEVKPLYSRYSVQLGKMLNPDATKGPTPFPYLRNVNVQWDEVDIGQLNEMDFNAEERAKYRLMPGDLLVCEGGDVGRTAVWRGELDNCFIQKTVHRVRPTSTLDESRYLFYVMFFAAHQGVFVAEGNRSTIVHLTAEKLLRHRFPFPPLNEQRAIVTYLDRETTKLDTLASAIERQIEKLKEYRAAVIAAAVTGKIDVREEAGAV